MRIILTMRPRKNPFIPIEAEGIVPSILMTGAEITVWEGNRERRLDEVFEVSVEGEAATVEEVEVVLRGDTSRLKRVGQYMGEGRSTVEARWRGALTEVHGGRGPWKHSVAPTI